jgi:hypothetical protein
MNMELIWPAVFSEPLEAPYFPERPPEERRMQAVADGLVAWGNACLTRPPASFGMVLIKLSREAGLNSASGEAFMAAAMAEDDTAQQEA